MLDVLAVALFQAVAGAPAEAPASEPAATEQTEAQASPAPVEATEAASAEQQAEQPRVTCRTVRMTGSRLRTERVCRTDAQSRDAQRMFRDMQDRAGGAPGQGEGG